MISAVFYITGCGCGDGGGGGNGTRYDFNVTAGEEVLFSAGEFCDLSFLSDPLYAKYEWIISDGITLPVEGRCMTHVFITPGIYQVTLSVTQGVLTDAGTYPEEWDDEYDFPEGNTEIFTRSVLVAGESPLLPPLVSAVPLLELTFENTISDNSPDRRAVEWADGSGTFVQGIKGQALDISGGRYIRVKNPALWLGGSGGFTVTFWARKKDTTKDANAFMSLTDGDDQIISYTIYNNASAPTDCNYRFQMLTSDGGHSTSIYVRDVYENTLWHHYAFTYSSAESSTALYLDGRLVASSTHTGTLSMPDSDLMIGWDASSGAFNGYIDELKIYNSALTARDLAVGFELWHADFHARSAQYLYVQIPEIVTASASNRLRMSISGGALGLSTIELTDRTGLQSEEKVFMNNSLLDGSQNDYILTSKLLDSSGDVMYTLSEKFKKIYNGMPRVAVDENNSMRVDGELFFPVTPWGLNNDNITQWTDNGYINSLFGQGFWGSGPNAPSYTVDGYREYLDLGLAGGMMTIGPSTSWDGQAAQTRYFFQKSSDPDGIRAYAEALGRHQGQLMWGWWDEPELNGIPAEVLRAWTYVSHMYDGEHPVVVNFMGHPYTYVNGEGSWWSNMRHTYTYGYSKGVYGLRRQCADVVGFDYYSIDAVREDATDTMRRLSTALETMRLENFDLLPVVSCVETTDPGNGGATPWPPSAEQLRMMIWLNVVHEVKGIMWFHYFPETPEENYQEMTKFTKQITELAPAVLGPRISRTVSIDYKGQTGRIDTMLREYNGVLYLLAVRVSEAAYQDPGETTPPPPVQDYSLYNVSLSIGDDINDTIVNVYEESRTVAIVNGQISDSFEPFAVHIYLIAR